jgi:hypothetical protein
MLRLDHHRSPRLRALLLVAVSAPLGLFLPLVSAARARALAATPASASFDDLMVDAEHQRAAGAYAQSAALYGRAYRARPAAERSDEIGESVLRSAMTDYDLALGTNPNDLALLEAQTALLDEFLTARRTAHVTEQVTAVPQDLVDEQARIDARIAELRTRERDPGPEPARDPGPEPARDPKPARSPKASGALLGVGVTTAIGGVALVIGGAVGASQAKNEAKTQREALAAEPLYTEDQRTSYLADLDDWQDDWRSFSTALVVSGAVLTATGIGLTTWGIVRMRKRRQSSTRGRASLAPSLGPGRAGATLNVAF